MMQEQKRKIEQFRKLHVPGDPLVLYNVWDAGSARAISRTGAKAIATSSWAVAEASGFTDGENVPLTFVIDNLRRIVKATKLPVTVDLESGYGIKPKNVGETIALAIDAGAVGCNLEDSIPTNRSLRETDDQADRIRGARQAADAACLQFFINARTDIFLQNPRSEHNLFLLGQVIRRAEAYKEAGADGLFVPGLADSDLITELAESSPLPINVLVNDGSSLSEIAKTGVARVSVGGKLYLTLSKILEEAVSSPTIPWSEFLQRRDGSREGSQ